MSIYTRTGDDGTTAKLDGSRVSKSDAVMEALGTIDELSSHLGLCAQSAGRGMAEISEMLQQIQAELVSLGGEIAAAGTALAGQASLGSDCIERIETLIDQAAQTAGRQTSFVLPGGTALACQLHIARTVCRRAERRVVAIGEDSGPTSANSLRYLNRLGDLLFTYARMVNYEAGMGED